MAAVRQKQKLPVVTENDKESEGFQKGEWRISVRLFNVIAEGLNVQLELCAKGAATRRHSCSI